VFRGSEGKINGTRNARDELGLVNALLHSWIRPIDGKPRKEHPKLILSR
jgi:hypothetical protein